MDAYANCDFIIKSSSIFSVLAFVCYSISTTTKKKRNKTRRQLFISIIIIITIRGHLILFIYQLFFKPFSTWPLSTEMSAAHLASITTQVTRVKNRERKISILFHLNVLKMRQRKKKQTIFLSPSPQTLLGSKTLRWDEHRCGPKSIDQME